MSEEILKALRESEAALAARTNHLDLVTENLQNKQRNLDIALSSLEESNVALISSHIGLAKTKESIVISNQDDCTTKDLELRNRLLLERTAELTSSALELTRITEDLANAHEGSIKRTKDLESRNIQLTKANAELMELLRQRDDFVASITHDLKNPLIGCNKVLEAILDGHVKPEDQHYLLQQIKSSNTHMLHMIWNLLDSYKHHAGVLTPVLACTNLISLLHSILSEFSFQMTSKQQTVNLEFQASFPDIAVDRILIRRALFNLVDNAIKFTPEGGSINVICSFDSKSVRLSVQDSGCGISFEMRERLFQQFWQGKRGKDNDIGTGLGLYLTKNIIEMHGGTLEFSSKDGAGAEFTIILPR